MNDLLRWIRENWIEVCGMLTGFIYLWFSVKQSILTWPFGLLSALLYIVVFFRAGIYAQMGLQFYYLFISFYGWWSWLHPVSNDSVNQQLQITRTGRKLWIRLLISNLILFALFASLLKNYTDSPIPFWDSFTTSASIVATWMLARKKYEHWFLWLFIDSISVILYLSRGLYPTTLLFIGYTIMAVVGYLEWRKELIKLECQQNPI